MSPKPLYQFALALVVTAFSFASCNNEETKKEEVKADTTVVTPVPVVPVDTTTTMTTDTVIQKPTAPGD